jgi:hypothetical protein
MVREVKSCNEPQVSFGSERLDTSREDAFVVYLRT